MVPFPPLFIKLNQPAESPTAQTKLLINSCNSLQSPFLQTGFSSETTGMGQGKEWQRGKKTKAREEDWMSERAAGVEKGKNVMSPVYEGFHFCLSRIEQ